VVGAGVSGLAAASRLHAAGLHYAVLDKGRSVGGRLATRRVGDATFDHGAPAFSVRSDEWDRVATRAAGRRLVQRWDGASDLCGASPCFVVPGGVNRLAKHLAAGLRVSVESEVESIGLTDDGWAVTSKGQPQRADSLVLTAPVPQSLALLRRGGVALPDEAAQRLAAVQYRPALALLTVLDRPVVVGKTGVISLDTGVFQYVVDNVAKHVSAVPAVTWYASYEFSSTAWERGDLELRVELLSHARPWMGDAKVVDVQLKRWRYAEPLRAGDELFDAVEVDGRTVWFAGDAFGGGGVEGAYRSGRAAGDAVAGATAVTRR